MENLPVFAQSVHWKFAMQVHCVSSSGRLLFVKRLMKTAVERNVQSVSTLFLRREILKNAFPTVRHRLRSSEHSTGKTQCIYRQQNARCSLRGQLSSRNYASTSSLSEGICFSAFKFLSFRGNPRKTQPVYSKQNARCLQLQPCSWKQKVFHLITLNRKKRAKTPSNLQRKSSNSRWKWSWIIPPGRGTSKLPKTWLVL